ncbi:MAG TPA: hypothetical protein VLV18_07665 [Terriglobales bacterium]|nr:hypothetical protein [Terriglobales bacterium]
MSGVYSNPSTMLSIPFTMTETDRRNTKVKTATAGLTKTMTENRMARIPLSKTSALTPLLNRVTVAPIVALTIPYAKVQKASMKTSVPIPSKGNRRTTIPMAIPTNPANASSTLWLLLNALSAIPRASLDRPTKSSEVDSKNTRVRIAIPGIATTKIDAAIATRPNMIKNALDHVGIFTVLLSI